MNISKYAQDLFSSITDASMYMNEFVPEKEVRFRYKVFGHEFIYSKPCMLHEKDDIVDSCKYETKERIHENLSNLVAYIFDTFSTMQDAFYKDDRYKIHIKSFLTDYYELNFWVYDIDFYYRKRFMYHKIASIQKQNKTTRPIVGKNWRPFATATGTVRRDEDVIYLKELVARLIRKSEAVETKKIERQEFYEIMGL